MSNPAAEKALVDFVRELGFLQDNQDYGDLRGQVVADLGGGDGLLHEFVLGAGAAVCYVAHQRAGADPRHSS